jgi:hypothetical protein
MFNEFYLWENKDLSIVFNVKVLSLEIIQVNLKYRIINYVGVLSLEYFSSRSVNKSNHRFFPFVEILSLRIFLSRPDKIYYESQFDNIWDNDEPLY